MIKASELRIRNLVFDNYSGVMEVSSINEGYVSLRKNQKLPEGRYDISSIEPIPLTEEWLIKFGFSLTISNRDSGYKQYEINKNGFDILFSIECNCSPECFVENIGIDILYVHQLQNLYSCLTGEELTFKN